MDQLEAMRAFRCVVERESFTGAARQLGVSVATVSRLVGQLEEHLGARLLQRSTRALHTTEAGRAWYDRSTALLDALSEAEQAVRDRMGAPAGLLRVTAPTSFGVGWLAAALAEALAPLPDLRIEVHHTDRFVDLVAEGFDLAIRAGSSLPDTSLVAARLGTSRRVLCATPAYVARCGAPERPEALAERRCLLFTGRSPADVWSFVGPDGPFTVRVRGALAMDSSLALREATLTGLGPCMLPGFVASADLAAGRLLALLPEWEEPRIVVSAMYPAARHLSPKVRVIVAMLRERAARGELGLDGTTGAP